MMDKTLNLYSTAPISAPDHITVFDDYVGGGIHFFKITNLDSYMLGIYAIYIDGVAQDLSNVMFKYIDSLAWGYDDYGAMHTHQLGGSCEFSVNATGTGKRVKIVLNAHVQGAFARVETAPYNQIVQGNMVVGGGLFTPCIELTGTTPYIDFKNSGSEDYDMRLIMASTADKLQVGKMGVAYGQGKLEHI